MKKFIFSLVFILFSFPVYPFDLPKLSLLEVSTQFAPPHNEPVIGDRVARYRLTTDSEIWWYNFQWKFNLTGWGVNKWRTSEVVGHGFPEAWENSDWSIEEIRWSTKNNLNLWLHKKFAFSLEYYMPINRHNWGGHGFERHYYTLFGFTLKLK